MKPPRLPPEIGLLAGMGFSVALWLTLGVLAGRWVDRTWEVAPWGTLGGSLVGIVAAAVNVYQIIRRLDAMQTPPPPPHHDKSSGAEAPDDRRSV